MSEPATYRSAPGLSWLVEPDGLVLTSSVTGAVHRLRYPEAAVWDWISRGESWAGTVRNTGAVARLDPEAAQRLVRGAVCAWVEAGLLVARGGDG